MLLSRQLSILTFTDLEAFCKSWAEGTQVEYKAELRNVPKTICAMCNTMGGVLVLGVEYDENRNRVTALPGLIRDRNTPEGLVNSCVQGIYPPVVPEIHEFPLPTDESCAVYVLRVQPSRQAPHAISNSRQVYIRTGDVSHPEDLADMSTIEYLLARRSEVAGLGNRISAEISHAFASIWRPPQGHDQPTLDVFIQPLFPWRPIASPEGISDLILSLPRTRDAIEWDAVGEPHRLTSSGVLFRQARRVTFVDQYGHIAYRQVLGLTEPLRETLLHDDFSVRATGIQEIRAIDRPLVIVLRTAAVLAFGELLMERCGVHTPAKITTVLGNILHRFISLSSTTLPHNHALYHSLEESASGSVEVRSLIRVPILTVIQDCLVPLYRAFNVPEGEGRQEIEYILQRNPHYQQRVIQRV